MSTTDDNDLGRIAQGTLESTLVPSEGAERRILDAALRLARQKRHIGLAAQQALEEDIEVSESAQARILEVVRAMRRGDAASPAEERPRPPLGGISLTHPSSHPSSEPGLASVLLAVAVTCFFIGVFAAAFDAHFSDLAAAAAHR